MTNRAGQNFAKQIERAGGSLFDILKDVDDTLLHTQPAGSANSIAATIAHIAYSVDAVVNGMVKQTQPLLATMPTGISDAPPTSDALFDWYEWGTQVKINMPEFTTYAQAVFDSATEYVASLTDDALDAPVETPFGETTTFDFIHGAVLGNALNHIGEISALKGINGVKGYSI